MEREVKRLHLSFLCETDEAKKLIILRQIADIRREQLAQQAIEKERLKLENENMLAFIRRRLDGRK